VRPPIPSRARSWRAQAAAASAVVVATIITLVTSAFGFVAALAWNHALTTLRNPSIEATLNTLSVPPEWVAPVKAILIALIAIVAVVILNRVARRMVKQSAINAADADSMMGRHEYFGHGAAHWRHLGHP
jgi:divalent metal cation (Fe/Co/Zn/Cd) transporter